VPSTPHSAKLAERGSSASVEPLGVRRVSRRLAQFAAAVLVLGALVVALPGLASLRRHLMHAAPGWMAGGVALELLSVLSYVVIFRSVFCERMCWRLSCQIGMAEQGANSLLSASGAGGLAVGVWAFHRLGVNRERIARRTVAFFLLTSMANFAGVITFALFYLLGALGHDPNPALTYSFAGAALIATAFVLALPAALRRVPVRRSPAARSRRVTSALRFLR
jgi:hypothetical protein